MQACFTLDPLGSKERSSSKTLPASRPVLQRQGIKGGVEAHQVVSGDKTGPQTRGGYL